MDAFSDIKNELRETRETAQKNMTSIRVLETTVVEKHLSVIEKIEKISYDVERVVQINTNMSEKIEKELTAKIAEVKTDLQDLRADVQSLSELANTTKASLKTIWVIGGIIAGAISLFSGILPGIK